VSIVSVQATIPLGRLRAFGRQFDASSIVAQDLLTQWAVRYRTFVQRRFVAQSRGAGEWLPLIRGRRRGSRRRAAILRDTDMLFGALSPSFSGSPGQHEERRGFSIIVGYGGPARHPGSSVSVADIASFHQVGAGFLPVRKIIVAPDGRTLQSMHGDGVRAAKRAKRESF